MTHSMNHQQPTTENTPLHLSTPAGAEIALSEEDMTIMGAAAVATTQLARLISPQMHYSEKIGELNEKVKTVNEENSKLREKLKAYKKDNVEMSTKIETLENKNRKQEETIRYLETTQEKLQKELESVKKAKDLLRVELGKNTSKFITENENLTKKLEALTKELEVVTNENKELKRLLEELTTSMEELTTSNNSLKETVDSIKDENQKLKVYMGNLKAAHEKICKKLKDKETKLELGQVAWILEAEIWKIVLPDEQMGKSRILYTMERWLKRNSKKDEGMAAQKRWDELKVKLNWNDDDHKSALKILKDLRVDDAHPKNVDMKVARKELKEGDYVADTEKQSCEEIINMIEKLNPTT